LIETLIELSTELPRVGLVTKGSELLLLCFRDGIGLAEALKESPR
jgi:hypothetical protein